MPKNGFLLFGVIHCVTICHLFNFIFQLPKIGKLFNTVH